MIDAVRVYYGCRPCKKQWDSHILQRLICTILELRVSALGTPPRATPTYRDPEDHDPNNVQYRRYCYYPGYYEGGYPRHHQYRR